MLHNYFWLKSTQLLVGQALHTFLTQPRVYRDYNSQTQSVWLLLVPGFKPETGFKGANENAKTHLARQGHPVIPGEIKKPGYISHVQTALPVAAMRYC